MIGTSATKELINCLIFDLNLSFTVLVVDYALHSQRFFFFTILPRNLLPSSPSSLPDHFSPFSVTLLEKKRKNRTIKTKMFMWISQNLIMKKLSNFFRYCHCSWSRGGMIMTTAPLHSIDLNSHCTKKEVFHQGFLQQMWPNPQKTADLVTFVEEILNGKL